MSDLWVTLSSGFATEEHDTIAWWAGKPTYLLLHGFLGTPAEWRPIATVLHRAGCSVVAPLLPGFGRRLGELPTVTLERWVSELQQVTRTVASLQPLVIVGFSLGGALAIQVAAMTEPAGLVLLAPFSRLPLPRVQQWFFPILDRLSSGPRPFARVNFDDPALQHALTGWNPLLDVRNPVIRQQLQSLRIPWRLLHQLARTAKAARHACKQVRCPVIIVHGRSDTTVPLRDSQVLARCFPTLSRFYETEGDHQLVRSEHPSFSLVCDVLLDMRRVSPL
ncbi:MAG: alpha/beta hydrolase [Thermomicrobium sp.]